jgi:hypothetical protein
LVISAARPAFLAMLFASASSVRKVRHGIGRATGDQEKLIKLVQLNKADYGKLVISIDQLVEFWIDSIGKWISEYKIKLTRVKGLLAYCH